MLSMPFVAIISFVFVAILSYITTWIVGIIAKKYAIWDDPQSNPHRKKQRAPVPLLGGTAPALVAMSGLSIVWLLNKYVPEFQMAFGYNLEPFRLYWVLIAAGILLIGGFLDDCFNLSPKFQIIPICLALCVTVFLGGVTIDALSYPFDTLIPNLPLVPELLALCWLGFCIAATKFLDGHDGLVTTVGFLSILTIASVSLFAHVNQPMIFIFAVIWAAAYLGFLPHNFPNASIYLGEGGSEVVGFSIGFLSILSGAKIATASTVIGWFIIDLFLVWLLRFLDGRNPLTSGDRLHWHFRLVDLGMSKVQVLVLTSIIITITAHIGLLFATGDKVWLLVSQSIWLVAVFGITFGIARYQHKNPPK